MPRTALARAASRKTRELPRTTLASIVVVSRCVNPAERLASEVARSGHLDRLGRAQMATSSAPKRPRQFRTKRRLLVTRPRTAPEWHGPRHDSFEETSGHRSLVKQHFSMSLASAPPPPVTARARVRRHRAPRGIAVRASSSSSSSTDGADLSRRDLLSSGASVAPPPTRGVHLATRIVPPSLPVADPTRVSRTQPRWPRRWPPRCP